MRMPVNSAQLSRIDNFNHPAAQPPEEILNNSRKINSSVVRAFKATALTAAIAGLSTGGLWTVKQLSSHGLPEGAGKKTLLGLAYFVAIVKSCETIHSLYNIDPNIQ